MRLSLSSPSLGLILTSALASLVSCATLEPIPASTCGNGVVDSDREDCDSFPTANCGKPSDGIKACRLTCERKQAPSTCPTGWGCGVDGICRQSQGIIEPAGAPASAGAAALISGDFDGDGRVDVIGAAPYGSGGIARVHFYDGNANLETTVPLQVAVNLPVIRDFNKDGLDDVGFNADILTGGGALSVLAGSADRTFATLLFPALTMPQTEAWPIPIVTSKRTVLPQGLASTVVAIINNDQGPRLISIGEDAFILDGALNIPLPFGPSVIAAQPRAAVVFNPTLPGNSVCGDIVVPWNDPATGKGKITLISPCSQTASGNDVRWNNKKPTTFDAPGPISGLLTADLNLDGFDDIIVETKGTNAGIYISSVKDEPTASAFKRSELKDLPLAVADLTGDNIPDFVFPAGVVISAIKLAGDGGAGGGEVKLDGIVVATPRGSAGLKWADAQIGNFNGDNIPDILVRYENQLDAELLGNAGDGRFTRFVVRSDKAVRAITNGDFDGDLIQDVAYLSSSKPFGDPSGGDVDLVIAYGKNAGGTETPRVVGRFKNARALASLKNEDTAHDDLGVLELIPSGQPNVLPTTSVTVIFGSGERQAIAPLFLQDERSTAPYDAKLPGARGRFRFWAPTILTAGAMSQPNTLDVFAIAIGVTVDRTGDANAAQQVPFETGAWIAGHDPNLQGGIAPFAEVARLTPALAAVDERTPNQPKVSIVSTVGDIDVPPNGIDEVVNIARTPDGRTGLFVVRPSTQNAQPKASAFLPDVVVSGGDPIELIDVDSDGAPDLVFITEHAGKRKLFVMFNDGKGDFNPTPSEIRMPAGNEEPPVGFAKLVTGTRADGKLRMEIAIATRTHLAIASLAPGGLFETRDLSDRLGKAGATLTGIVSGDFDGNGTQDIAIADSGSVRILRQLPRLQ